MDFLDKDALRLKLPLAYVCGRLGIDLQAGKARCPWHEDANPSFHLYVDWRGVEKFACAPCGVMGDVYDLIQRVHGLTFPSAVTYAEELLGEMPDHVVSQVSETRVFDNLGAASLVAGAAARTTDGWLCVTLGLAEDWHDESWRRSVDTWLAASWGVGVLDDGAAVFPHYDALGALTGVKFRDLGGKRWSLPGSSFTSLYGVWRERRHREVVLCEGETDALWASMQDPPADIYALPSGASKFLEHWTRLEADTYHLAFDADEAGDEATKVWQDALAGKSVRVLDIPRGEDLKSAKICVTDLAAPKG